MNEDQARPTHETAGALFSQYGEQFGRDLGPYRNHVHRVLALIASKRTFPPNWFGPSAWLLFSTMPPSGSMTPGTISSLRWTGPWRS